MPPFKGNNGNLMQHWVLCELLAAARSHANGLTFVDAHAMAPLATRRTAQHGGKFDAVFANLPGQGSAYEQAWQALAPRPGTYPNSASFVHRIWWSGGQCSMLLCEKDSATVSELRRWAAKSEDIEIAPGDWRERFKKGLLELDELTLISFDPNMFNRHRRTKNTRNMYPDDLDLLVEATRARPKDILVQLSTYDTNDNNPQNAVSECIRSTLEPEGFEEVATIAAKGKMMSLVYQRGVDFSAELTSIYSRFDNWFRAIRGDSAP